MPLNTWTVDEVEVSVFPVNAEGEAQTDTPLWIGAAAENVTLSDSLEEIEDRPSGSPFPEVHHGAELHEITIGRLWESIAPVVTQPENLSVILATADLVSDPPVANAVEFRLRPNQIYVVVLLWSDADDPEKFIFRRYSGVTDRSYEISGQTSEDKRAAHKWRAQYMETGVL